jgi:hypothetical protein
MNRIYTFRYSLTAKEPKKNKFFISKNKLCNLHKKPFHHQKTKF